MYEAIFGVVLMGLGIALAILGCRTKRRSGNGTGSNTDPVRDGIERAGEGNKRLEDAERATSERLREQAETIERTGRDNQDAQELVQKARNILASAKHTD